MVTFIAALFWLGVVAGLLALYGLLAGRFLQLDAQPDAVSFMTTSDGWRLALSRYRPARPLAGAPPVLLCPGFALSAHIFDLGPDRSLARYLAQNGYDVWVLDWRGRGRSERPRLWGSRRFTWCFDDYVAFDLPAALEALQAETGKPRSLGIGFGLGGLALLIGSGGPPASRLAGVAALGSAAFFRRAAFELPAWSLRLLGRLRLEALVRLAAPLLGRWFPTRSLAALQNRDAVEPALYRRALVNAASSPSRREARQLEEWLRRDQCAGLTDERDYRPLLAQVALPVLLLSGIRDLLAPPESIEQTAAALASAERQLVQASRLHGMASNYGHLDLLIGANAPRDIYPHLLRWLDLHSGVEVPAGRPEPPHGELPWPATTPSLATSPAAPLAARSALASEVEAASGVDENSDMDWLEGDVPRVPRPNER